MKGFIVKQLKKAQEEVNKRLSINETFGLDMASYENNFSQIFIDTLVEYFKYIGCKDDLSKPYNSISDQIYFWLWERQYEVMYRDLPLWTNKVEKKSFNGSTSPIGYIVNIESPNIFYDYIVDSYMESKENKKATYTLKEVRQLLEKQKQQVVFSMTIRSESLNWPSDGEKIIDILNNSPLIL